MVYVVATKFDAFYVANTLKIKYDDSYKKGKRVAAMTDCWRITRSKKLFYSSCTVRMRYIRVYGKIKANPEDLTFKELEKEINNPKKFKLLGW